MALTWDTVPCVLVWISSLPIILHRPKSATCADRRRVSSDVQSPGQWRGAAKPCWCTAWGHHLWGCGLPAAHCLASGRCAGYSCARHPVLSAVLDVREGLVPEEHQAGVTQLLLQGSSTGMDRTHLSCRYCIPWATSSAVSSSARILISPLSRNQVSSVASCNVSKEIGPCMAREQNRPGQNIP